MAIAAIHEAKLQLSRLVDQAMNTEEFIIAKAGRPMVRLVPIDIGSSARVGGLSEGQVRIADDFATLSDVVTHGLLVWVEPVVSGRVVRLRAFRNRLDSRLRQRALGIDLVHSMNRE
jgi:prevent-host-death family protein